MPRTPAGFFTLEEALEQYQKVVNDCLKGEHPAFQNNTARKQHRYQMLVNSHLRELYLMICDIDEAGGDDCCPGTVWDPNLGMCVPEGYFAAEETK